MQVFDNTNLEFIQGVYEHVVVHQGMMGEGGVGHRTYILGL